jgi:hypothetical protein
MNIKFLIFVCLFTFILNVCEDLNEEGKLPNLYDCVINKKEGKCCLATFKSGGKYYSFCSSDTDKKDLKNKLKDNGYKHIEIFCDDI